MLNFFNFKIVLCPKNNCKNQGFCVLSGTQNTFSCICPYEYTGALCDVASMQ